MKRRLIALLLLAGATAWAADEHGHDHGDSGPVANANGPTRLPDGSVFLPKPYRGAEVVATLRKMTSAV